MKSLKRRTSTVLATMLLLALGTIGFAVTWQGSLPALFEVKAAAAENAPAEAPPEAMLTVGTCDGGSNVDVESSGGTPLAGYATVKLAFDAINAGTHTGTIIVEVCASTTEGATAATLNSTGAGAASYTSVNIYPIADGVTVTGNPGQGFGVIQLNGVDNVTLDGDNPNTAGTNRNLTVSNTTTTTLIAASAVRVATSATVPFESNANITIKNLSLLGNVIGGNSSLITSTTGSSNSSFGIIVGPNGGTSVTAITSVTGVVPAGASVNGLVIDNNSVNQCARGIAFIGNNAASSTGITITNNTVGASATLTGTAPFAAPATTVYTKGIYVQGTTAYNISGNTVQSILSFVATTINGIEIASGTGAGALTISNNTINGVAQNSTAVNVPRGIALLNAGGPYTVSGNTVNNIQLVGSGIASGTVAEGIGVATAAASGTISGNKVSKVYNNNPGSTAARGINLGGGSNITVQNNFISDVNANGTGGFTFDTSFGTLGLRIASGTGHKIYHNSVNMSGSMLGAPSSNLLTAGIGISATTLTGIDVRNNIFSNLITGGTTSAHVSMFLPTNAASAMTLTLNNNDYNSGPSATTQGIAQGGTTQGTGFYLASNFNAATTTPATNLRALTTLLGPATNDDSSKVVDPVFASATDPHLTGLSTAMIDAGVNLSVLTDIDNQVRPNGPLPDIGADEFYPAPGSIQLSSTGYVGNEGTTLVATAVRVSGTSGIVGATYTLTDGSATGGAACTAGIDYINTGGTVTFPDSNGSQPINVPLCGDAVTDAGETFTITLSAPTGGATLGSPTAATATITDVPPPFAGTINVGTAQAYTSLTNPGGIFEAINLGGSTGAPITINITSDLTGESGSVALNQVAGGSFVTIKPSGAARNITSTAGAVTVIKLNDADNVTIDGSLSGGTDRSLTITSTNTASATGLIWLASAANGAQNNTVKNLVLAGGVNNSTTTPVLNFAVISSSSGSILTGGTDNDNNVITNNFIKKLGVGIIAIGGLASNMNQNTVISNNTIGPDTFGADQMGTLGILAFNENALSITGNEIKFIGDSATTGGSAGRDHVGISLCTGAASWIAGTSPGVVGAMTNAVIARNRIHDIVERGTFSSAGIVQNCPNGASATSISIVNNMIYNVMANGTGGDQAVGIGISQGNGDLYANNSIYMAGDVDPGAATSTDTSSHAIKVQTTAVLNPTISNNISVMNLTSNTVGVLNSALDVPASYAWGTGGSNNNDLYATAGNTQARVASTGGTTFFATLALWQAASTQDAASISADPLFISGTDLHLQALPVLSPAVGVGSPLAAVTNDYDQDPRPTATNPDIGADEIVQGDPGAIAAGTYYNVLMVNGQTLGGDVNVTNTLYLTGKVTGGSSVIGIGCNASVVGHTTSQANSNYVIGSVRKDFCTTGSFVFPVGTTPTTPLAPEDTTGTSPMTANITALGTVPSSLTVRAFDAPLAGFDPTKSVSRNWSLTEGGDLTADLTFQYRDEDIGTSNENDYRVYRRNANGTTDNLCSGGPCVTVGTNEAFVTGITAFSRWQIAEALVPTAASADISGRVLTADGRPIANVRVILSGGPLTESISSYTGQLGYFNFADLPTGQNYVLTVKSRRFSFMEPSRVVTLNEDLLGLDFVATPQE